MICSIVVSLALLAAGEAPSPAGLGDFRHEWTYNAGGTTMATDAQGNVILTGGFGIWDFDPTEGTDIRQATPFNVSDIFVVKLGADGSYHWAYTVGGPGDDGGNDVAVDAEGNVYVTGFFQKTVDFDAGPGEDVRTALQDRYSFFLFKLSRDGEYRWTRTLPQRTVTGAINSNTGKGVAVDPAGDIVVLGHASGTYDFDFGPGEDLLPARGQLGGSFVLKLDSNGNYIWGRIFGASGPSGEQRLVVDRRGDIYVGASFSGGMVDADPGPGLAVFYAEYAYELYVNKLTAAGDYAWTYRHAQLGPATDDGIILFGNFREPRDFDPGEGVDLRYPTPPPPNAVYNGDLYVSKLFSDGSYAWTFTTGESPGLDVPESIAVLADGSILVTGYFQSAMDFDPGPGRVERLSTSSGGSGTGSFLLRLSPEGTFLSVDATPDTADDALVAADPAGNVYWQRGLGTRPTDLDPTCGTFVPPSTVLDSWGGALTRLSLRPRAADFNLDGRVDLLDYAAFQNCFEGPGAATCNPGCDEFDVVRDNAIDAADFPALCARLTGP